MNKPILFSIFFLCLIFSFCAFGQKQTTNDLNKPNLKTQTMHSNSAPNQKVNKHQPELTASAVSRPRPQLKSAGTPIISIEQRIQSLEKKLATITPEYRKTNPQLAEKIERLIEEKKLEKSLRDQ